MPALKMNWPLRHLAEGPFSQSMSCVYRVGRALDASAPAIAADAFIGGPHFILSVLASSQRAMAMHFARPAPDKFADWSKDFEEGIGGCPRLRESVATFECTTYSRYQEGDHTILLGRVESHSKTPALPLVLHMGEMGSLSDLAKTLATR